MTTKHCIFAALLVACLPLYALAQPSIHAVVNAASNEARLAPGSWMAIYGTNLAAASAAAPAMPLSASLGGVSVTVNGVSAPLLFVSPNQINAQVPFETAFSQTEAQEDCKPSQVTVSTAAGRATHALFLSEAAPALYTRDMSGQGRALVLSSDFQMLDAVSPGQTVVLYAAGLGATDPPAVSGHAGMAVAPFNRVAAPNMPDVYIGDRQATVLFAGLAPGLPGVYQLNVQVPEHLASDRVQLRWGTLQSNIAHIGVPGGHNVANATGSITSVFPNDGAFVAFPASAPYGFSLMPQIARFSASLDILPGAAPFSVLAAGEIGTAMIDVDPPHGVWQAGITVPSMAVRSGDYSSEPAMLMDYQSCRISGAMQCDMVAGSIVPFNRQDPGMVFSFFLPPSPNTPDSRGAMYTVMGTLPADGHFVIDSQTFPKLATFGGVLGVPLGYSDTRVAPLSLYIDGHLVASANVTYPVVSRPQ
jgi:uncharacterized protein (TIGR03437 family)